MCTSHSRCRVAGLAELCEQLLPAGKEQVPWAKMAAVLVTARLCEPSSELHIAEDWYRRTALPDLLQLDETQVNKDRLYRAVDQLLAHKEALEAHLSRRCGELFSIDNEVLLYDVTSAYFEGQAAANALAQRGYKTPRLDANLCPNDAVLIRRPKPHSTRSALFRTIPQRLRGRSN